MIVNKICIFGAGSAGWTTALALKTYLPDVKLTLINPTKHGNIGVGESTQPNLVGLLLKAGIDIQDLMKNTDATLKHGIYYKGWNEGQKDYWHPFTNLTSTGFYTRAHHYTMMSKRYPKKYPIEEYYKSVHPSYTLCVENNLASTSMDYALHIDADKLAKYLRTYLEKHMTVVDMDSFKLNVSDNKLKSITCNDSIVIESDLFIDCSGFNRVLIGEMNGLIEDNYEGNVNCALFGRIPYGNNVPKFPYTRAEAHGNGWVWTIPLESRVGSGFVYNDKFISEEQARHFFKKYWNDSLKDEDIRKIKFSSSSLKNPWINNVCSIGLSSGFVEPLEATGIAWFVTCSETLSKLLKNRYYDDDTIKRYNSLITMYVEDVQDFVDVHYSLSNRNDTEFWKYQTNRPRHERLQAKLDCYKKYMPNKNNRNTDYPWAFNDVSWLDILNAYKFEFDDIKVPEKIDLMMLPELFVKY